MCPFRNMYPRPVPQFGRNVYSRYDYEGVTSEAANKMVEHLEGVIKQSKKGAWAMRQACRVDAGGWEAGCRHALQQGRHACAL